MHRNSASVVSPGGASKPTTSYFAPQTGQWNSVATDLDMLKAFDSASLFLGERSDFLTVPLDRPARQSNHPAMGFNRRKMEDERRHSAEKEV
jgi:hypothetical protein